MKQNPYQALARMVANTLTDVESWLKDEDGAAPPLSKLKGMDQVQLLRLRTWSLRYFIPIKEILDMVLPILRNQMHRRGRYGIGVPVRVLTGRKAQELLEDQIKRRYPEEEQIKVWASRERDRQVLKEIRDELGGLQERDRLRGHSKVDFGLKHWTQTYVKLIEVRRKRYQQIEARNKRSKRRMYRRNPWRM